MKPRLTRTEMDTLAAAAKSGDRQAFEQLISATIGLYYHLARWVPAQDREDVVSACVVHTYHALDQYNPAHGWITYAATVMQRYQRRYYAEISLPVKVSTTVCRKVRQAHIPDRANGIADPSMVSFQYLPIYHQRQTVDELAAHQDIDRLRRALARSDIRDQDSVLMEMQEFCVKHGVSRQRYHQLRGAMLSRLRKRMQEGNPCQL